MLADRGWFDFKNRRDVAIGFSAADPEQYFILALGEAVMSHALPFNGRSGYACSPGGSLRHSNFLFSNTVSGKHSSGEF